MRVIEHKLSWTIAMFWRTWFRAQGDGYLIGGEFIPRNDYTYNGR